MRAKLGSAVRRFEIAEHQKASTIVKTHDRRRVQLPTKYDDSRLLTKMSTFEPVVRIPDTGIFLRARAHP